MRKILVCFLFPIVCVMNGMVGVARGQVVFNELRSFGFPEQSGVSAEGTLMEGGDGMLYGTTREGGMAGAGTIFRVGKDGQGYAVIKHFDGSSTNSDGASPRGGLIQASDGLLYGTTSAGGISNKGSVFRINADGSNYLILKNFPGGSEGASPIGELIQANDGRLYGMTSVGGLSNKGTVFGLNPDGSGFGVIKSFSGATNEGGYPVGSLIQGTNGALYGVTGFITNNLGTVFTVNPDGSGYAALNVFRTADLDGSTPLGGLVQATNGFLFGTMSKGGVLGGGIIFKLRSDGRGYSIVKNFTSTGTAPRQPNTGLTQGNDGALYGVSKTGGTSGYGTVFKLDLNGGGFSVVKGFTNSVIGDAEMPYSRLLVGSDGYLYGTTELRMTYGGSSLDGALYRLHPDGSGYQAVWLFLFNGGDGEAPSAGPILATNGVLYGTTSRGGTHSLGTVYRMNRDGTGYALLKIFAEAAADGFEPQAQLLQANNGMLYGTCSEFGGPNAFGTVFRMNLDGNGFSVIHTFTNSSGEGLIPYGGLIQAGDGMLYGTTQQGGAYGNGTVFRMNLDGSNYSVIWSFAGTNGMWPQTTLVEGENGFLYGTTSRGGLFINGTVFKMKRDGSDFQLLHSFKRDGYDGVIPYWPLVFKNGVVYGSTLSGGYWDSGSLYRVNGDGTDYRVLKSFEGAMPYGLTLGRNDVLYGVTSEGGEYGGGTVFQINLDGTGYGIVKNFSASMGGALYGPYGGLMQSLDGLLYGVSGGGTMNKGTIFSLDPAVSALNVRPGVASGSLQIILKGVAGRAYSLQKAPSAVGPWNTITTLACDVKGDASFTDTGASVEGAFYRTIYP